MFQSKPISTKSAMSSLVVSVILASLAGNGSVLAILARFKALRTFPNILLANLVLVDFLCALVNMPLFLSCYVLEADEFDEENLALAACSLQYGFIILNLASMSAMLLDRFLAVYMDFRYYVWKTKKKAVVSAALIWFFSSFSVVLTIQPALDIELADDSSHLEYRWLIYQAREPYITFTVNFFILSAVGLGIMTTFAIRQKKTQRAKLNLSPLQAEARLRTDIRATKTVVITVAAFLVCHIPTVAFTMLSKHHGNVWFQFFAVFCPFISSASNPFIYALRTKRFFSALKQFFKDPCGKTPFQEKAHQVVDKKMKSKTTAKVEAKDIEKPDGKRQRRRGRKKRAVISITPQPPTQQFPRGAKKAWCEQEYGNEEQAHSAFPKSKQAATDYNYLIESK